MPLLRTNAKLVKTSGNAISLHDYRSNIRAPWAERSSGLRGRVQPDAPQHVTCGLLVSA